MPLPLYLRNSLPYFDFASTSGNCVSYFDHLTEKKAE